VVSNSGGREAVRSADERPEILTDRLEWRPGVEGPPLEIALPQFFTEALNQ
jgi:hypothetical protein